MSRARDFFKGIEGVKRRTDISKAEIDFKLRKVYEQQRKALSKELGAINRNFSAYAQTDQARARLSLSVQEYLDLTAKQVDRAVTDTVQQVARQTAEAHVKAEQKLLRSAGLKPTPQAFLVGQNEISTTVARTLEKILRGTAYPDGYTLSQRIWGNSQALHKDIHTIIMEGMREGRSIADISDRIKSFVDPKVAKLWNKELADGYRVYRRNVEYNSQRLARTVAQHAYQTATEDRARSNPFIVGFRWIANGGRACPICLARDGTVYEKGTAPLDHPNGMCTLEPVFAGEEGDPTASGRAGGQQADGDPFAGMSMDDRLVAWDGHAVDSNDPGLAAWARSRGYTD